MDQERNEAREKNIYIIYHRHVAKEKKMLTIIELSVKIRDKRKKKIEKTDDIEQRKTKSEN